MKTTPTPARIAAALAAALIAASAANADIAPPPGGPGFARKWFGSGDPPRPAPPPEKVVPAPTTSGDLATTISEAGMPQLMEALIQTAPSAGDAARSYMEALYRDRMEKQQTGQITPEETRQLIELRQMVENGTLAVPDAPSVPAP